MGIEQDIRVRIAPSPTGYLHIGTVRTALYNYLFAKKEQGAFVIRIEDTDQSRSLPLYEQDILEGLRALGLRWDEGPDVGGAYGPYRQSERADIYRRYMRKLLDEEKVYKCFCTKEQLDEERKAMVAQGLAPKYSGHCRGLSAQQIGELEKEGKESVLRLKVPADFAIEFHDVIRGKIGVNASTIGDIIVAKGEASPLYNLAVVIDDAEMKISHVIRGEDHISNTPKQILIQLALGLPAVTYAHLPLILSPDKSKLSKRSLETSFAEYLSQGYLPEALVNFIALMGWHPEGDAEIFSLAELVEKFSLKRVQKAGAVFNMDKLDWFNAQYLRRLSDHDLLERLKPLVPEAWLQQENMLLGALHVEKERMEKLSDFRESAAFFFEPVSYDPELLRWQDMSLERVEEHLRMVRGLIPSEEKILAYAEEQGRGEVLWPLRVALSGMKNSPSPFEIISVLGKNESLKRIDVALEKIADTAS